MSKIIRKPLIVPDNVELKIEDLGLNYKITVKGPKGTMEKELFNHVKIELKDKVVNFNLASNDAKKRPFLGTAYRLISNMIEGVVKGFEKRMEVFGVGYKAAVNGKTLKLSLGYSHDIDFPIPEGIDIKVDGLKIIVSGIDKEKVGLTAAKIRELRKPDPYKGKGVRYEGENPVRKVGKKAVASK